MLARSVADIETLEAFYVRVVSPVVVAAVTTAGLALWFGILDLLLAVPLLGGLLAGGLLVPLGGRLAASRAGRVAVWARAEFSQALVSSLQGQVELIVYGRREDTLSRLNALNCRLAQSQLRLRTFESLAGAGTLLAGLLALYGVLLRGAVLVESGRLPGTLLAVLVVSTAAAFEVVAPLPGAAVQLESALEAGRRLFALADLQPAVPEPAEPRAAPSSHEVRVENVSFRYPGQDQFALRNISFSLSEGKKVALVGPNGAGKSTLLALLLRFWLPQGGRITLGGADLACLGGEQAAALYTVVPQRGGLLSGTLAGNLRLANPTAGTDQMRSSLAAVGLAEWLDGLPEGLDTWIGERGAQISAGQRQRLAVARALLKNAPIVLLDEPAAHLDAESALQLANSLQTELQGRSQLWVTHRLLQMEYFDEILVLSAGQIVERGDHSQLMRRRGLYSRLVNSQQALIQ